MIRNIPIFNKEETLFYIAGAITGTDDYAERFQEAEDFLTGLGYKIVNPVKVTQHLPSNTTWEQYMHVTRACLEICNAIYLLDGWHKSKGATSEYYASKVQFPPLKIVFQSGTLSDLYDKRFPIGSRRYSVEHQLYLEIVEPSDFHYVRARCTGNKPGFENFIIEQEPEWFIENTISDTKD